MQKSCPRIATLTCLNQFRAFVALFAIAGLFFQLQLLVPGITASARYFYPRNSFES